MTKYWSRVTRHPSLSLYRLAHRMASVAPFLPAKVRESLAGRAAATDRWAAWAGGRPAWFHAASVGEALAAEPVMRRLRAARPDLPLVLTYTSPSLARWPRPLPVTRADFAPAEDPRAMERVFAALKPRLLAFSSSDLWPEMLAAAERHGVPVAVVGGAVKAKSPRLAWPACGFLQPLYRPIRFIGALDEAHAARWLALGVPRGAVMVTGDPRHDQVLERVTSLSAVKALGAWAAHGPVLVAGSLEPDDVGPLASAYNLVRAHRPDARLLIVPHDPSSSAISHMRRFLASYSAWTPGDADLDPAAGTVVVQALGLLPDLYLLGRLACVGGRHSVLEAAACACPVIEHRSAAELARQWLDWLENPGDAWNAGLAARRALAPGASGVTTNRLLQLIG